MVSGTLALLYWLFLSFIGEKQVSDPNIGLSPVE